MKKILLTAVSCLSVLSSLDAAVVINEVYAGGGNAGAPFTNDFVELYNNGLAPFDISGYILQYAPATTAFSAALVTFSTGTVIPAQGFYLVSGGSGGANGVALPAPGATSSTNFATTAGKIRLTLGNGTTVVDLVGYGATADTFEGTGPAPAGSNTQSVARTVLGVDNNQNTTDFTAQTPSPVPEPSTYAMILGGVGMMALIARRKMAQV